MKTKMLFKTLLLFTLISAAAAVPWAIAQSGEQPVSIQSIEDSTVTINVEGISDDNTDYYLIFDKTGTIQLAKIQSNGTTSITAEIENNTTFSVAAYNTGGTLSASSTQLTVYIEPVILEEITLQNDIYITELTKTQGDIDLNSHTLHVFGNAVIDSNINVNGGVLYVGGNLIHSRGALSLNYGLVDVAGDYKIINYIDGGKSLGNLRMTKSEDRLNVGGSFVTDSAYSHTGYLTDGVFRLKGDFSQINSIESYGSIRYNFDTTKNFKIIFCGNDTQTVYFQAPKCSMFNIWEIENTSEVPMEISNGFGIRILKQDSVIPCDVEFGSSLNPNESAPPINLNGYTLRIKGNVINNRVAVVIAKGQLIIEGDYTIRSQRHLGDNQYSLRWSYGTLQMLNDEDYVLVMGDFFQDSYFSHTNYLIAGTLEIKGNFTQRTSHFNYRAQYNFDATGTHKVILSGDSLQVIKFEDPEFNQFNVLEIPYSDQSGHIILFISEWRASEIINNSPTTALLTWYE